MKNILIIVLIVVLLIGIYTYAHINRYDLFTVVDEKGEVTYFLLDRWTGKTYVSFIAPDWVGEWIYLGTPKAGYKIPQKRNDKGKLKPR